MVWWRPQSCDLILSVVYIHASPNIDIVGVKFDFKLAYEVHFRGIASLVTCYTLSGRIGQVVASHAAAARSSPAEVALIYAMHVALRGYCK